MVCECLVLYLVLSDWQLVLWEARILMYKPWLPANLSTGVCSQAIAKQANTTHSISNAIALGGHLPSTVHTYLIRTNRI